MSEYTKLDPELKKKWVTALRSGKYSQGRAYLYQGGAYCCLGVLAKVDGYPIESTQQVHILYALPESHLTCPLQAFLRDDLDRSAQKELENMNDGVGRRVHSFTEIANWVEANL